MRFSIFISCLVVYIKYIKSHEHENDHDHDDNINTCTTYCTTTSIVPYVQKSINYNSVRPTTDTSSPTHSPTFYNSSSSNAYVTYHSYYNTESLLTVACSDGQNGLVTRWGYNDLSLL